MFTSEKISELTDPDEGAGVVAVLRAQEVLIESAWGLADRASGAPMTPEHRIAIASGSKGFTAVTALSLVAEGALALDAPIRSVLGEVLPGVGDAVTLRHLLSHTSGLSDYLDDDADVADYLMPVPVSSLVETTDYLPLLAEVAPVAEAGADFSYSNAGFVLLALVAEMAGGAPFHELVRTRVFEPAGMAASAYTRSDEPSAEVATPYVQVGDVWRTTVHHLPVRGGGDGGASTTAADVHRFWTALLEGRLLPQALVEEMSTRQSGDEDEGDYGLGVYLPGEGVLALEGYDAGSSFRTTHHVPSGTTTAVLATTCDAAWDLASELADDPAWDGSASED